MLFKLFVMFLHLTQYMNLTVVFDTIPIPFDSVPTAFDSFHIPFDSEPSALNLVHALIPTAFDSVPVVFDSVPTAFDSVPSAFDSFPTYALYLFTVLLNIISKQDRELRVHSSAQVRVSSPIKSVTQEATSQLQ